MNERERLDGILAASMDAPTRGSLWAAASSILDRPISSENADENTGLALGYVQSGKTTSITALTALAADSGYQLIVALLGSTNLLLDQNKSRLEDALGIGDRTDYRWISETNPVTDSAGKRIADFLERGRTCLLPVLKNAGRINAVAEQLSRLPSGTKVLIIDDEADQASLNTSRDSESRTYAAIKKLRKSVPFHLYVQYTATPYAPLLLDAADILSPHFVEFLVPGNGYTGGKEFFIDNASTVVRNVPLLDEQASKTLPIQLQSSLLQALASFLAGAAMLLVHEQSSPPISMLVHSTARNDVQARYDFLIKRQLQKWREQLSIEGTMDIPTVIQNERDSLVRHGIEEIGDSEFLERLSFVLRESTVWLVNSAADVNKVDWHVAPIHILIGGNKLDRGFTVEGLTVTYMNRPASPQVDTLEQRSRAFGYRGDLLPYCQFFGSKKTIRSLTEIVHTEEDLRARLREHIETGGSVRTWSAEIGLLLPAGMVPTRSSVVSALSSQALGWHPERRPVQSRAEREHNQSLLDEIGLSDAAFISHGRLRFRTIRFTDPKPIDDLLNLWKRSEFSAGWLQEEFLDAFRRKFRQTGEATIMLMGDLGAPRTRKWDESIGFVNLFQGRDLKPQADGDFYPGDRNVLGIEENPDQIVIQVHRTTIRGREKAGELLAIALYLGTGSIIRRSEDD